MIRGQLIITTLLGALSIVAALGLLHSHLGLKQHQLQRPVDFSDSASVLSADEVQAAGLNYRTAAADLIWMQALLYRTERRELNQPARKFTDYAEIIIDLDPHFAAIYPWHNIFRYGTLANPSYDDLQAANRILATGLEYFPIEWGWAEAIVINHHHHNFQLPRDQRLADLRQGLKYAEMAAEQDEAPAHMTGLALNFRTRIQRLEAGLPEHGEALDGQAMASPEELDFLIRRYFSTSDERQRQILRHQIERLGGTQDLMAQVSEFETLFSDHHRRRFAYIDRGIYPLIDVDLYRWDQRRDAN